MSFTNEYPAIDFTNDFNELSATIRVHSYRNNNTVHLVIKSDGKPAILLEMTSANWLALVGEAENDL